MIMNIDISYGNGWGLGARSADGYGCSDGSAYTSDYVGR